MRQEKIFEILRSPVITEKSTLLTEGQNKYVFKVHPDATKDEVKKAVEAIFSVKVLKVAVVNIAGKVKRFKGTLGRRANIRKAIVTVAEGQTINTAGGM